MEQRPGSKTAVKVVQMQDGKAEQTRRDIVATEERLETRLIAGSDTRRVAVKMRTPGTDFELAAGFLFSEGVIARREDIRTISYCWIAFLGCPVPA